jgi:hypothetical protein
MPRKQPAAGSMSCQEPGLMREDLHPPQPPFVGMQPDLYLLDRSENFRRLPGAAKQTAQPEAG